MPLDPMAEVLIDQSSDIRLDMLAQRGADVHLFARD